MTTVSASQFDFTVGEHHVRGRVDRVDRLPEGDYELIDYKTGERKSSGVIPHELAEVGFAPGICN